jgi:hypothetical protein
MGRRIAVTVSLLVLTSIFVLPHTATASMATCSGIPVTGSGLSSSPFEQRVVPVTLVGTADVVEFVAGDDGIYARLRLEGELRDSEGRLLHEFVDVPLYGGSAVRVTDIRADPATGQLVLSFDAGAIRPQSWFISVQPSPLVIHAQDVGQTAGLISAISSAPSGKTNATIRLLNLICAGA